jgi:hypothetical protein
MIEVVHMNVFLINYNNICILILYTEYTV